MLILLRLFLALTLAHSDELYQGLPAEITPSYPEQQGFVRFEPIEGIHAPMLSRIAIDGGERGFSMADVFDEQFFALLPRGQRIVVGKNAEGLDVWSYPPGTKVIHRIFLRTEPRRIFELRIVWRRPDGSWAYGLYAPKLVDGREDEAVRLKLLREGGEAVELRADLKPSYGEGGAVKVTGGRINVQSCQACHFMSTPSRHQYPSRDAVGPCGFVPNNPALEQWARDYQARHGYWPFRGK